MVLSSLVMDRVHRFAAALPAAWLARRGAALPAPLRPDVMQARSGVPVLLQRRLLEEVARRGGERAILGLGQTLGSLQNEPLLFLMLNSASAFDLLEKGQRFERGLHSDHHVRVVERGPFHVLLEHRYQHEAPTRLESLYVLGLYMAMFELLGHSDVSATLPDSTHPGRLLGPHAVGSEPGPAHEGALPLGEHRLWRISWTGFAPVRQPMAGLDALLLESSPLEDLARGAADVPLDVARTLKRIEGVVRGDLARRWTLGEVAAALGTSTRSLQRAIQAEGATFARALDDVRVRAARDLLRAESRSITEISYRCGFADAAHFSRRFRSHFGLSPRDFRRAER